MCAHEGKYYKANGAGYKIEVCVDSQWVLTFLSALVSSMAGWHDRIFEPLCGRIGIIFLNLIK